MKFSLRWLIVVCAALVLAIFSFVPMPTTIRAHVGCYGLAGFRELDGGSSSDPIASYASTRFFCAILSDIDRWDLERDVTIANAVAYGKVVQVDGQKQEVVVKLNFFQRCKLRSNESYYVIPIVANGGN